MFSYSQPNSFRRYQTLSVIRVQQESSKLFTPESCWGVSTKGNQTLAELELAVVAKSPDVVTEMISGMDRGGTFRAELRSQNLQRGRGESGSEYELFVIYMPRAGAPATTAPIASVAASGGNQ